MRDSPGELNPLVEIEHRVQARAKDLALDVAQPAGEQALRQLIDAEIEQWADDFKRGGRPFALAGREVVAERAFRNLARYGPLTPLLDDGDVWEIMINAPDAIFVKRHAGPSGYHDEVFHDDEHLARTLTKLLDDASSSHRKLDPAEGLQDAQLDDGSRLHIVHGDVARGGHLMVNIRRFTGVAFRSLDELVERDMLSPQVAEFLAACVRADLSIVFAGAPGSGKTTLLSCCAAELDPSRRVVIAEEVFEADVPLANVASMQTRAARSDRPAVDLRRLVSGFLRMAPDVAIVGEVRDREALPLLLTLSSGVKGFTTIHAGSARQALTRLRFICQLSDAAERRAAQRAQQPGQRSDRHRRVLPPHARRARRWPRCSPSRTSAPGPEATQFTVTELFSRRGHAAPLLWSGNVPARAARHFEDAGIDLDRALGHGGTPSGHAVTALLVAIAAGYGAHLLGSAVLFGWRGLGPGPPVRDPAPGRAEPGRHVAAWLAQAGLGEVAPGEFAAVIGALFVAGRVRRRGALRRRPSPRWSWACSPAPPPSPATGPVEPADATAAATPGRG